MKEKLLLTPDISPVLKVFSGVRMETERLRKHQEKITHDTL
jgi:hypothetical protein